MPKTSLMTSQFRVVRGGACTRVTDGVMLTYDVTTALPCLSHVTDLRGQTTSAPSALHDIKIHMACILYVTEPSHDGMTIPCAVAAILWGFRGPDPLTFWQWGSKYALTPTFWCHEGGTARYI